MMLGDWIALANLASVSVIPLIVYLHNSNKARWTLIGASLKKIAKQQRKFDARIETLESARRRRYNRSTGKQPIRT